MAAIHLQYMRAWLVILSTINLIIMIASISADPYDTDSIRFSRRSYQWWGNVASCVILCGAFIFYSIPSIRGNITIHRYLRAVLMFIPAGILMGINYFFFQYMSVGLDTLCAGSNICMLSYFNLWTAAFTGTFTVIEVGMTLAWGRLLPEWKKQGTLTTKGLIVSPDQQPSYAVQMSYLPQQQQQPMYFIQHPQPTYYNNQQQQQPYYAQQKLPYEQAYPQQQQQPFQQQQQHQPSHLVGPLSPHQHQSSLAQPAPQFSSS
ncbi:hypothetical protein BGX29_010771 [Mortierella sp. GBA35]|nr:hypothetical protein BGX29_010771 [Mortierella sp. GBA35]